MAYFFLSAAFILNAAANILLKIGATRGLSMSGSLLTLVTSNWQALLGLTLFASNVLFYFLALRALPLSVAYPVMVAMSFFLINGFALLFLHEQSSFLQIAGYVCILMGIILVVAKPV